MKIHLIEGFNNRPREGEIVRTKCGMELVFRPFSPNFVKGRICNECEIKTRGVTRIPNYLSVAETAQRVGA